MKDIKIRLKKYIRILNAEGISVKKVILYGSYAKGTANETSDIDVCIVSDNLGKDYYKELIYLSSLASKVDDRIEPVPFTPADLNDKYNTLASEIRKYGKTLP